MRRTPAMIIRCYHCSTRRFWWMTADKPHLCYQACVDWAVAGGWAPAGGFKLDPVGLLRAQKT